MNIKPVSMYPCPVTGKLFKTAAAAKKSGEDELAKIAVIAEEKRKAAIKKEKLEEMCNYIRLNLTDVNDLPRMLTEKAKEFFDITIDNLKINVSFGNVSNSHGAPLNGVENWSGRDKNLPTSYLGWSGQITGKVVVNGKLPSNCTSSATDYLFSRYGQGFRGFHTSSGCPGSIKGEYEMDIGFYFFLSDFPQLESKYQEFLKEKEKFISNNNKIKLVKQQADDFAETQPEVVKLVNQINKLTGKMNDLIVFNREKYIKDNTPTLEANSKNFASLKKQFVSRYGEHWLYED